MQIKENIKAPHHWPLCGEFTGTGEFPAHRANYAENVSIWWRHHANQLTGTVRLHASENGVILTAAENEEKRLLQYQILDISEWRIYAAVDWPIIASDTIISTFNYTRGFETHWDCSPGIAAMLMEATSCKYCKNNGQMLTSTFSQDPSFWQIF